MEIDGIVSADNTPTTPNANSDMVHKERVAELIKQTKLSTAEKTRLEMEALYAEKLKQPQQNVGGIAQPSEEELYGKFRNRLIEEATAEQQKAKQEQLKERAAAITDTFFERLSKADREAYKDFDEVTGEMDIGKFPQLVQLATEVDNTSDVWYELTSNPGKLANMDYLAKTDPKYALAQIKRLSDSIKSNQQAKQEHLSTNPPLDHVKPSASAGTDGGDMSIKDLRKLPSLRG